MEKIARSLVDKTADEQTLKRRAGSVENVVISFHDNYVVENSQFRSDAGLSCYITRTAYGKCCDWCNSLVGRYEYGTEPKDVYRRHDNCHCKTIYENDNTYQDVWSKKTWKKSDSVPPQKAYEPKVLDNETSQRIESQNLRFKGLTDNLQGDIIKLKINLFDKTDSIYYDTFAIEEEVGFQDIYLHGSPSSVQIIKNNKPINLSVDDFVKVLKDNGYKGGDIRLASCSTGAGDNSFAQQLSAKLGVTVKAPDDDVYFLPDEGILFVGSPYGNTGKWRKFKSGVEIYD